MSTRNIIVNTNGDQSSEERPPKFLFFISFKKDDIAKTYNNNYKYDNSNSNLYFFGLLSLKNSVRLICWFYIIGILLFGLLMHFYPTSSLIVKKSNLNNINGINSINENVNLDKNSNLNNKTVINNLEEKSENDKGGKRLLKFEDNLISSFVYLSYTIN